MSAKMRAVVTALVNSLRAVLRATPAVAAAWVFGSVARGQARHNSDLDVAVLLRYGVTALDARRELMDLAARVERAAGRRADLLVLGLNDPIVAHRVLSEGTLIHDADPERRIDFTSDVLAEYIDWGPCYEATARRSLEANLTWARETGR